jgi:hypothetical protein
MVGGREIVSEPLFYYGGLAMMRQAYDVSLADIEARPTDVRYSPKSGHWNSVLECPLCAKSRHRLGSGVGA